MRCAGVLRRAGCGICERIACGSRVGPSTVVWMARSWLCLACELRGRYVEGVRFAARRVCLCVYLWV